MSPLQDLANPFCAFVCGDPWATPDITIPNIHATAYDLSLHLLEQVCRTGKTTSLLVHGPAGIGKTHLIARLRQKFTAPSSAPDPGGQPQVIFCWVRLDNSVGQPWQYLRRSLFIDLLRKPRPDAMSQLDGMLRHQLPALFGDKGSAHRAYQAFLDFWLNRGSKKHEQLRTQLSALCEERGIERDLREVLLHLHGEHAEEARDWLRGARLPEKSLNQLGLGADSWSDLKREEESFKLVTSLCRLAGRRFPVVVCFDQVEGVELHPQDDEGLRRFAHMIGTLHDQSGSAKLLISFILSGSHDRLKAVAGEAPWERLACHKTALSPLLWEDARTLALKRLDADAALAELRCGQGNPLWPLEESTLRKEFDREKLTCTPREWLKTCAKEFDRARKGPTLDKALNDLWEKRCLQAKTALPGADKFGAFLAERLPCLVGVMGAGCQPTADGLLKASLPDVGLILEAPGKGPVGIGYCKDKPRNFWRWLERVMKQWGKKKLRHLALVLPEGSKQLSKAIEVRICALEGSGVKIVHPSPEQLAALEVLRSLLADAQEGNLVYNGLPVDGGQVRQWAQADLAGGAALLGQLKEFSFEVLAEFLTGTTAAQAKVTPAVPAAVVN
jgi:hypothetical protein